MEGGKALSNYFSYPFAKKENLQGAYVIAGYTAYDVDCSSILQRTSAFSVGQTIGTWIPIPGISPAMVENYQGRVLEVHPIGDNSYRLRIAFPQANFSDSLAMMLTSLLGNDMSTSMKLRLTDLEFTDDALAHFTGPRLGMDYLRKLTGVQERPLVLNMIKPCSGFTAQEGAKLFFEVAKGGMDLIKDDELLGSPEYNVLEDRVHAYLKAAEDACELTGKRTQYIPNITAPPAKMRENARIVLEAGGKACMVNCIFAGYDALAEICEEFGDKLFVVGHYAGSGIMAGPQCGMSDELAVGLLPRLSGASCVMTSTPEKNNAEAQLTFVKTMQNQRLPLGDIAPCVLLVGGGITPINQVEYQAVTGKDAIIGIGGAVQGHPMGATVGAQTAVYAVESTAKGIPLEEAAVGYEGLRVALEKWQ